MRRAIERALYTAICILGVASCATSGTTPMSHLPALAGDYFEFQSRAVGRPFHIHVRLPQGYENDDDARYPVVYVLDGDSIFPILAANHLFLHYDEGLPEAIIVGIAYGSFDPAINLRAHDFSPAGAPAFQAFLEAELIPHVEDRYRADASRRVLFGQSRGGAMVLHSAFTKPDLFWGRIASNPAFSPEQDRFFGTLPPTTRDDLGLVVTSGSRDRADFRADALNWFATWERLEEKPWALRTVTIDGGTHGANSADSYRAAMLWLFNIDR